MQKLSRKEGFTLIEVIISMAILSIIIITFLGVFGSGITGIFSAGHRSRAGYSTQIVLEDEIGGTSPVTTLPHLTKVTDDSTTNMDILFEGSPADVPISVPGRLVTYKYDDGKRVVTMTTFLGN